MAQPSTSSPSRPQLLALDSSPVKTHSLLDQNQGQDQEQRQREERRYQQHSLQVQVQVPLQQQQQQQQSFPPAPSQHRPPHQPPHATQRDLSNTSTVQKSHPHSSSPGPGHVSNGGEGDATIAAATAAVVAAAPATSTNGGSTVYAPPNYQPATTAASSADLPVHVSSENGQNETRYNSDTPLSTSPLMSNSQPPSGPPRQPVSYPNPTSYPPSGMPSAAQYAFPPQVVAPPEPYRPTPTALPSMRTLDHVQSHQQLSQQQQHQHQHQHPQQHPQQHQHQQHQHQLQLQHQHQHHNTIPLASHMGAPMAPGPAMGYYNVPTHPYGMHTDPTGAMRFSIAPGMPPDPRIAMSGGRHKKEIKRRTKTGCLTCRKRRIKCDETHPTCNNCKKSKRECLGYDPIFKQQQGPAAIQPAPNSGQQPRPSVPQTLASTPTVPSSATQHPPYQPPVVPSSYPASLPSNVAFDSPVASTPQSAKTDAGFDYSTAIDPALQGADTSSATGTPSPQYSNIKAEVHDKFDGGQGQQLRAKKMKVDELIALGGAAPPTPTSPPSATLVDEITKLYYEIYVPGLTLFFESQWYTHGKDQPQWPSPGPTSGASSLLLHQNKAVLNLFTSFLQNIIDIKSTDPADMIRSGHLETHVVWALARLPLSSLPRDVPLRSNIPPEDDLLETTNRLHVFETLLSGDVLETNPLWSPNQAVGHGQNDRSISLRRNEFEFWHHLGQFLLRSHSSISADSCSTRERYLSQMRSLLDGRENRDVLYSIAVLREYTMHWDATVNEQTISSQLDESEPRSKLAVATRFIRNEASTEATTNVVRQFANLAYRAFVRPGVNAKSGGKKA